METKKEEVDLKKEETNLKNRLIGQSPLFKQKETFGQKAADSLTRMAGSWAFIIFLSIFMLVWIYLNSVAYVKHWDPWPFIILNLTLSCLAAMQAPVILMSQNRENQRDRAKSNYDYLINRKSEREIIKIEKQLNRIERKLEMLKK